MGSLPCMRMKTTTIITKKEFILPSRLPGMMQKKCLQSVAAMVRFRACLHKESSILCASEKTKRTEWKRLRNLTGLSIIPGRKLNSSFSTLIPFILIFLLYPGFDREYQAKPAVQEIMEIAMR